MPGMAALNMMDDAAGAIGNVISGAFVVGEGAIELMVLNRLAPMLASNPAFWLIPLDPLKHSMSMAAAQGQNAFFEPYTTRRTSIQGNAIYRFRTEFPQNIVLEKKGDGPTMLKWTPSINPDVTLYKIFKNGKHWQDLPASQHAVEVDETRSLYSISAFTDKYNEHLDPR